MQLISKITTVYKKTNYGTCLYLWKIVYALEASSFFEGFHFQSVKYAPIIY